MSVAPLRGLRVSSHLIPSFNLIPNTSLQNYPLIIYHECFSPSTSAAVIEAHLRSVGVVEPQWRYTMYSTTHFHSTTHEVLCIASGRARLCFGVGHRLLQDLDGGFEMIGSYPKGKDWDMCYGREDEKANIEAIKNLAWFDRDPIYGDEGPALQVVNGSV
ncbi:hypothetical protein CY34DRAFT_806815 [Suillus luteus UH-Slu-Lm8-n1]|uniref:Unplaced genomic scaffold CY34scaffold_158, whole genome shotgun sequence n=1 Tax=Suillus luteus UH-Slu-Lm8-n1 TaxID=930992 RepID=A0A0D0BB65_9AGAM|nr:hypothetical protein CY34DRAFT_806815 [Suillus luteus UH-Slu-Lm8-n1]